jgi:putative SOS response-associated peptidase YedK
MCNDYRLEVDIASIAEGFSDLRIKVEFPEGIPNIGPRVDIRITDPGVIVRTAAPGRGFGELVQRRWSWPGPTGKPVYNFRSDDRDFSTGRCLVVADGFYEFTKPDDPKKKLKDKWLFTKRSEPMFCIAGIWRGHPEVGEAFTMLTMPPGPDVAPYHGRQVAILDRVDWANWLDPMVPARDVLRVLPAGSLEVVQVG